ncbi:hypothetical protein BCY91_12855 [Pelobium manganitolerans]|uniref:Uncharacterized protein n=1 Tax=Pelobium manganitolerans TaxID=1842495 RepID=A0A419SAM7_9SPHI|nr:hypothetical protein [Pelobium manganitolerans]RKD19490.1 hypothetical protein BCY91_12855 [Pelobium manganitolerans]
MENNNSIELERIFNASSDFKVGEYLYMGMATLNGKKVCISVAYTLSYCFKKADEFLKEDANVSFAHVSKIVNGQKLACQKFYPTQALKNYY